MVEKALLLAIRRMAVTFVSSGTAELSVTALAAWFTAAGSRDASLQTIPRSGTARLQLLQARRFSSCSAQGGAEFSTPPAQLVAPLRVTTGVFQAFVTEGEEVTGAAQAPASSSSHSQAQFVEADSSLTFVLQGDNGRSGRVQVASSSS